LSKSPTSGLAGRTPKTLSMPNQKKTMESANRPKDRLRLLAHPNNSRSKTGRQILRPWPNRIDVQRYPLDVTSGKPGGDSLLFTPLRGGLRDKNGLLHLGLLCKALKKNGAGDRGRTGDVQLGNQHVD
jgi:hypothetical protein